MSHLQFGTCRFEGMTHVLRLHAINAFGQLIHQFSRWRLYHLLVDVLVDLTKRSSPFGFNSGTAFLSSSTYLLGQPTLDSRVVRFCVRRGHFEMFFHGI